MYSAQLESRLLGEVSIYFRYADDTTLMAESEDELKSLLMKVKEESEKVDFIDYAKVFNCVDHNKLWNILKEVGISVTLPASWEICMQVKKQQ